MSAELAETRARTRKPSRLDILRDVEYRRRLTAGEDRWQAWAATCTDDTIGLADWRGAPTIHVAAVRRTLASHLSRMAPGAGEFARASAEIEAAEVSREMLGVVLDVARGKFDDDKCDKALAQLKGATQALKVVGIGADKQVRVSTQVGVGINLGDVLRSPARP